MGALRHGMWMQKELSVTSTQLKGFQGVSYPGFCGSFFFPFFF